MLLLDLDRLRTEEAAATLLRVASERASSLLFSDQDTLNLVFGGRWHVPHPRWNAQYALWSAPAVAADVLGAELYEEAVRHPGILHFEGPNLCKPWHALNTHPWRERWWATLERTPWRGMPPEDQGIATSVLRVLPEAPRIWLYARVLGYRKRRLATRPPAAPSPGTPPPTHRPPATR